MRSTIPTRHRFAAMIVVGALVAAVAIPVLAADPSRSPSSGPAAASAAPDASAKPARSPKPDKPNRADKAAKAPAVDVTVRGTVARRTAADGSDEYVVQSGGDTLLLDAGPAWFHGDQHPLAAHVGKTVTIAGERREGSTEIEVRTVDGTTIREAGRPPWAGGWKQVGERHPGWTQEKWDRWQAKRAEQARRHGLECWPPGHCKDGSARDVTPAS